MFTSHQHSRWNPGSKWSGAWTRLRCARPVARSHIKRSRPACGDGVRTPVQQIPTPIAESGLQARVRRRGADLTHRRRQHVQREQLRVRILHCLVTKVYFIECSKHLWTDWALSARCIAANDLDMTRAHIPSDVPHCGSEGSWQGHQGSRGSAAAGREALNGALNPVAYLGSQLQQFL